MNIVCGFVTTGEVGDFSQVSYLTDSNGYDISDNSDDHTCSLNATFDSSQDFYLFVEVTDTVNSSSGYVTVEASFSNIDAALNHGDIGQLNGTVEYANSDFIEISTVGAGIFTATISPDNNDIDLDCGLTTGIGPSDFASVEFFTDSNGSVISNNSDDYDCTLAASLDISETFYLFVDVSGDESSSGPYTLNYSYAAVAENVDTDDDGFYDDEDNCPLVKNGLYLTNQSDLDNDGLGDVCDRDSDGDGVFNTIEIAYGTDPSDPGDADEAEIKALEASGLEEVVVPAMGGIGLLVLGLSMLSLGAVRSKSK